MLWHAVNSEDKWDIVKSERKGGNNDTKENEEEIKKLRIKGDNGTDAVFRCRGATCEGGSRFNTLSVEDSTKQ